MQTPNQKQSIVRMCESTLQYLTDIRKTLLNVDDPKAQHHWALGGFIITLVGNYLRIIQGVIHDANRDNLSAKDDLLKIKEQVNAFLDDMIGSIDG